MARSRTTKQIAKRITLDYFKKPNGLRRTSRVLVLLLSIGAAVYVFGMSRKTQTMYNPGPVSFAHAHFENDCTKCHDGAGPGGAKGSNFNLAVSDSACMKCHDGENDPHFDIFTYWPKVNHTFPKK